MQQICYQDKIGISLIICFYNAERKLKPTIKHILALNQSQLQTELILVNNNSTDQSENVIHEVLEDADIDWKLVREPIPGLANARICGIKNSKYVTMLFVDDDNWLDVNYLQIGWQILKDNNQIGVLGGIGKAVSDVQIPEWLEKNENYYAVGPQMPNSGEVKGSRNMVYGAGMFVQRSCFNILIENGFKFNAIGRTKSSLTSGEDSEMCLAMKIAGFQIWYDSRLTFKHYISPERLTLKYLKKLKRGISSSGFVSRFYRFFLLDAYTPKVGKHFWFKEALYSIKNITDLAFKFSFGHQFRFFWKYILFLFKRRGKFDLDVTNLLIVCQNLKRQRIKKNPNH